MAIIALLLGLYLGAKCSVPINVLLKALHDRFGRFEGMVWYTLFVLLLYQAFGIAGVVIALLAPAAYLAWQLAGRIDWSRWTAAAEVAERRAYARAGFEPEAALAPFARGGSSEHRESESSSKPPLAMRRSRRRGAAAEEPMPEPAAA
ncbi:MAG TPA: hypothetical protein VNC50_15085 [Planctomycetia bacterium]|jgi:hypothetical protein|nr:hypothetical protein [Planctomycetia bacterium]